MIYESTRDNKIKFNASEAILQGLSEEGGLFVLRELENKRIDIKNLLDKDYYEIAQEVLKLFLGDFTEDEIKNCVYDAYKGKFLTDDITPLVKVGKDYVLELFNGPTSAFKDVALSLLPHLTKVALTKSKDTRDILILTATSGDTGKAALEGFKDVDRTKIIVFYPNDGVSKVQELQMRTQEGKNTKVCAINGNFDDAQSGIKEIFVDEEFKKEMEKQGIKLSSANSINIGRLVPQMVYYIFAYVEMVKRGEITFGEKINFVVPTGNFGNILAGYYAKMVGLPINKLICASNGNNVLYDFIKTGVYNRKRDFLKTNSPSMDILISSNLERLLYYVSGCDNEYISSLMRELKENGEYRVTQEMFDKIRENFATGYATDEETENVIKNIYEKEDYLLDTHTAVAYKVLDENRENNYKNIILSTASPYKFTNSVYKSIFDDVDEDEFVTMKKLSENTKTDIPKNLKDLDKKEVRHSDVIEKGDIKEYILKKVGELK